MYAALLLGFLGVLLTVRAITGPGDSGSTTAETNKNTEAEAEPPAELALVNVAAGITGGVRGTVKEGDGPPVRANDLSGARVDLIVRNLASTPASLAKARLVFHKSGYPEPCYAMGGPLVSTADYTFTVPDAQPLRTNSVLHEVPFTLRRDWKQSIPPHGEDRVTLTVGPRSLVDQGNPWLGVFDVVLEQESGKTFTVGPVAVVGSGGNAKFHAGEGGWHIEKEQIPGCTRRNAALVAGILRTPRLVVSKELAGLDRALAEYR